MDERSEFIKDIVRKLTSEKTRDYTYLIIFFLIFSFFVFFAIRPSVITAVNISREEAELRRINATYEAIIANVVNIQTELQTFQAKIQYLTDAIPPKPNLNKLFADIERNAQRNSVTLTRSDIENVKFYKEAGLGNLEIDLEGTATFDNFKSFMKDLSQERRIKFIKNIQLDKTPGTASADLKIIFKITGFYL
jgi:Tfp pilus assembly protein PilO